MRGEPTNSIIQSKLGRIVRRWVPELIKSTTPQKQKKRKSEKKKDTDQSILHPCFLFSVCAFFTNPHKYTTAATVQDKAILQKTHFILSSTKIWNRNDHKSLIENSYR